MIVALLIAVSLLVVFTLFVLTCWEAYKYKGPVLRRYPTAFGGFDFEDRAPNGIQITIRNGIQVTIRIESKE